MKINLIKIGKAFPKGLVIGCCILMVTISGCANGFDMVEKHEYFAYGKTWTVTVVEHHDRKFGAFTGHGLLGWNDTLDQQIFLQAEDGKRIPVHKRIHVLQKDGSYKKQDCCYSSNTLAGVYVVDEKLFLYFLQGKDMTDCFVYPAGHPDNEQLPPGQQIRWIDYFGEFDPDNGIFKVKSFYAGGIDWEAVMGPEWKQIWQKESVEEANARQYRHRTPFICSGNKPKPD